MVDGLVPHLEQQFIHKQFSRGVGFRSTPRFSSGPHLSHHVLGRGSTKNAIIDIFVHRFITNLLSLNTNAGKQGAGMSGTSGRMYTVAVDYGIQTAGSLFVTFEHVYPAFFEVGEWGRSDACSDMHSSSVGTVMLELKPYPEQTSAEKALRDQSRKGYRPSSFEEALRLCSDASRRSR